MLPGGASVSPSKSLSGTSRARATSSSRARPPGSEPLWAQTRSTFHRAATLGSADVLGPSQQNQPAAPLRQTFLKPRQRFQQELHPMGRATGPDPARRTAVRERTGGSPHPRRPPSQGARGSQPSGLFPETRQWCATPTSALPHSQLHNKHCLPIQARDGAKPSRGRWWNSGQSLMKTNHKWTRMNTNRLAREPFAKIAAGQDILPANAMFCLFQFRVRPGEQ